MNKPLAALLTVTASVALLGVPAGAAVPQHAPAATTIPCNDGSGKSAQVWDNYWAAKNPCRLAYLMISYGHDAEGQSSGSTVFLAPGAHFNKGRQPWPGYGGVTYAGLTEDPNWCAGFDGTFLVTRGSHGVWQSAPQADC